MYYILTYYYYISIILINPFHFHSNLTCHALLCFLHGTIGYCTDHFESEPRRGLLESRTTFSVKNDDPRNPNDDCVVLFISTHWSNLECAVNLGARDDWHE